MMTILTEAREMTEMVFLPHLVLEWNSDIGQESCEGGGRGGETSHKRFG